MEEQEAPQPRYHAFFFAAGGLCAALVVASMLFGILTTSGLNFLGFGLMFVFASGMYFCLIHSKNLEQMMCPLK